MRRAIAAAALIGALLNGAPARAAGTLVGIGHVTGPLCDGVVLINGVNVIANDWLFTAEVVFDRTSGNCTILTTLVAANGPWSPASGGCVPTPGMICVGAVASGTPTTVPVTVCPTLIGAECLPGAATVLRL